MPTDPNPTPDVLEKHRDATKEKVANDALIINHFVLYVKDLPFDGNPEIMNDEHRSRLLQYFEKLIVEGYNPKIGGLIGYASSPGSVKYNDRLSKRRVEVVDEFLHQIQTLSAVAEVNSYTLFKPNYFIDALGESVADSDIDLADDRRVEIFYSILKKFPVDNDPANPGTIPRSKNWKIDFAGDGSIGYGIVGGKIVPGTLTMMSDNDPEIVVESREIKLISVGLSYNPFDVNNAKGKHSTAIANRIAKKLEDLKKIMPRFFEKLEQIKSFFGNHFPISKPEFDPDIPVQRIILEFFANLGISVGTVSWGGEFQTDTALSFEEVTPLEVTEISGSLGAFLAGGGGGMYLLTNSNIYTYTVMGGTDLGANVGLGAEIGMQYGIATLTN